MNQHLEQQLHTKHKLIFKTPVSIDCDDGWYTLIDTLCVGITRRAVIADDRLKRAIAQSEADPFSQFWKRSIESNTSELEMAIADLPIVAQVKEKFGELRFYVDNGNELVDSLVWFAEILSGRTCEQCGSTTDVLTYRVGWHKSLCIPHANDRYGREAEQYRLALNVGNPDWT